MRDIVISSVMDFLKAIDSVATRYATALTKTDLIFRGLSNYEDELIPGIYRTFSVQTADGPVARKLYGDATENEILQHFIKNAMSLVNHVDRDDLLTWLTYAQHFGAPTRLLDYSSNPLVSLYFCCRREPLRDGAICVLHEKRYVRGILGDSTPNRSKREVLDEIVASIIDPSVMCTPYPVTFIPHYIDRRMESQDSRFLVWGCDKSSFETIAAPFGDMLLRDSEAFFCKLRVDHASKRSLLRELSLLGVNGRNLFPGMDGIGRYITEYYLQSEYDFDI